MAEVKLIVLYPSPKNIDAFEKLYQEEHVPMAVEKLAEIKLIATKVLGLTARHTSILQNG